MLAFAEKLLSGPKGDGNDVDALIPELWASFGLAILENTMVAGNLIYRDFETVFAKYGDTVNTRKPQLFKAIRKTNDDDVTVQAANLTNIPVKLDQHPHVSFLIKDGEETQAMDDLVRIFLVPAMAAMAQMIDEIVLGQYARFLTTAGCAGALTGLTSSNGKAYLLALDKVLNDSKAPVAGRTLIVSTNTKATLMQNPNWTDAEKRGDMGSALRDASLGRNLGFDTFMCQNMASVSASVDTVSTTFLVNNVAGYPKGTATAITVDVGTGEIPVGSWVTFAGVPYQVSARTGTAPTTAITLSPPLRAAIVDDQALIVYGVGAVNFGAGYAANWAKAIVVDLFTLAPQRGQIVTFGSDLTNVYTIIGTPTATSILLDRPLVAAIADDAAVNTGPYGDYGFAFLQNALALVCRPLALPRQGVGAIAGAAQHNGFSLRVVITYDGNAQGHLVTLDALVGIATLEQNFGAVLLT